jgi:hypothetical protein
MNKRKVFPFILAAAALVFPKVAGSATEIFVSPGGNDAGAGTMTEPLATIAAARDKADELKKSGPVTVYLLGGTYYLKEPVVFGPSNSGTATAPISYKAYDKPVILSGGIKVTANWTAAPGSIMKTTIAAGLKVDQLFLNGKRQILARYPNFRAGERLDGYAADALAKAGVSARPEEGPGYIRALHNQEWGGNDFTITGKDGSTVSYKWVGDNNRGDQMHATYRMVENIYELLDAAGEWFYRKSTGELFFWPPSGTDPNTAGIELASMDGLIRFVGSGPTSAGSVKYVQFDGITFTHTYRTLFSGTYETVLKSDWAIVRNGAIFMQNTENITIKNCLFDQIGGNGVFMSGYNRDNVVCSNDFEDAGASCVCLFGLKSSVRCPNSWNGTVSCGDRVPGPLANEYPGNCIIENNLMNHSGRFEKQSAGIAYSISESDTIRHNSIHDVPRAGINSCDGCFGGHVIEFNWVYNSVQETGDHGPFNAWGRDRNEIFGEKDIDASKLDAWKTTIIRNNRFEGPSGFFGIDLDDQATNYMQCNNLLIGGGLKLQWHRYNTYVNNIIIRGGTVQFHSIWSNSGHYGARNIIVGQHVFGSFGYNNNATIPSDIKKSIAQWDSNVVYNSGKSPDVTPWQGGSVLCTWAQWQAGGLDVHSSIADPLFTDTMKVWRPGYLPRGDFNVKTGSPALAFGFKNFPMDSFGVMGTPGPGHSGTWINESFAMNGGEASGRNSIFFDCRTRKFTGLIDDDFQVTIVSLAGRTVAIFNGKGHSSFLLDTRRVTCGTYLAVVHAKNAFLSRRFFVGW